MDLLNSTQQQLTAVRTQVSQLSDNNDSTTASLQVIESKYEGIADQVQKLSEHIAELAQKSGGNADDAAQIAVIAQQCHELAVQIEELHAVRNASAETERGASMQADQFSREITAVQQQQADLQTQMLKLEQQLYSVASDQQQYSQQLQSTLNVTIY